MTEAIASVDATALVGVTDWCTHPIDLAAQRVRGTKNPDCGAIVALAPDLVIANKEENRRIDVDRLRDAGLQVWVTDIESVEQAFTSMRGMFADALGWEPPAWLDEAVEVWAEPVSLPPAPCAVAIWRDPWMVAGTSTFTGDLLTRLGLHHVFADSIDRYPAVALDTLDDGSLDLILLPDEPYVFSVDDGPEAFVRTRTCLAEGRLLTWYGPSLVTARHTLTEAIAQALVT